MGSKDLQRERRLLLTTLSLGEILLPEEMVMSVTNHRSAKQMRENYRTRDNPGSEVLHLMWIRSPPTVRAQASRTLSLYQGALIAEDT